MIRYRVIPGPFAGEAVGARGRAYPALTDALAVMGRDIIVDDHGRLVAFHECHLDTVTRLSRLH